MYGAEFLALNNKCINLIQSVQGSIMKQVSCLGKRSHHSAILRALEIKSYPCQYTHKRW